MIIQNNMNKVFDACAIYFLRFRIIFFIILVGIFLTLLLNIQNLKIDSSIEGFLLDSDPDLIAYKEFKETFGNDEFILVALEVRDAGDIFTDKFLGKIKNIHSDFENEIDNIENVSSLLNALSITATKNELTIDELLAKEDFTENQLNAIKDKALENSRYKNIHISSDGKTTSLAIKLKSNSDISSESDKNHMLSLFYGAEKQGINKLISQTKTILAKYQDSSTKVYVGGSIAVTTEIKNTMVKNMSRFMLLAIVIIILLLSILFKNFMGVILPLIIVVVSLLSTLGLMAYLAIPLKVTGQILPSFLLAAGVGAGIHFLVVFYYFFQAGYVKNAAIVKTLKVVTMPTLLASVTTALGLLSFASAGIAPVVEFGVFAAVGVGFTLFYTLTLLPLLTSFFHQEFNKDATDKKQVRNIYVFDALLNFIPSFVIRFPRHILLLAIIIIVIALVGISQIKIFHDPLAWLTKESDARQATLYIDQHFAGSNALEIIIDTKQKYGLYNPALLRQIKAITKELEGWQSGSFMIGKVSSITDLLSELNKALHNNNIDDYKIPERADLLSQELLLLSLNNHETLLTMVDSDYQKIRITMKIPWLDALQYARVIPEIKRIYTNALGSNVDIQVTGMSALLGKTLTAVIYSTISSYFLAFTAITLFMFVAMGNIKLGLVAMLPNLYPIVLVLGLMGYAGIPLDMFTMLIGSIAIGLAVDDTIHFMHSFKQFYKTSGNAEQAIRQTMEDTGRAMLFTSIVLSIGFFIFIFSEMSNLRSFGVLTGSVVILALLSDFILTPAILILMFNKKTAVENNILNH